MGFDLTGFGSIADFGKSLIDRLIPDKQAADVAKIKLMELEQLGEFKAIESALEEKKIEALDRASARQREADMAAANQRDVVPTVLALGLLLGVFVVVVMMIYADVDKEAMSLLQVAFGALLAKLGDVYGYYFGSSSQGKSAADVVNSLHIQHNLSKQENS